MKNAQQMREIASSKRESIIWEFITNIETVIESAANNGKFRVSILVNDSFEEYLEEVVVFLKSNKYNAQVNKFSDQREGISTINLNIDWIGV